MLNPWRLRLLGLLDSLGTVRAVAETLHLSPSTVSQQLAVLETETRSKLLERSGRRVRLTRSGVLLARRGREILDRMAEAEAELRALNDEPIGTVRLGSFQSAIYTLAVPAVSRLATSHPHLHVELIEYEPHESGPALRTGEVDVIVTTTDYVEFPWDRDLEIIPLGADPVVLVEPLGDRARRQGAGYTGGEVHAGPAGALLRVEEQRPHRRARAGTRSSATCAAPPAVRTRTSGHSRRDARRLRWWRSPRTGRSSAPGRRSAPAPPPGRLHIQRW